MAGPIRIAILANGSQARREFGKTEGALTRLGKQAGKLAAGGFAIAGAAAVKFGIDSVKAASDAQQSIGATEAIYGKYAKTVIKRSQEAADAVGLSANAYRESANLLGALFKNQGVELKQLSSTTDEHLTLASDLSAMYGGPVTDAVEALTAAYKGEFNQLEKYGVTLKQDTINTKANEIAKRKFGKELKKLTPVQESQTKQLATQRLLFKQTKDAAGTFGKEANTLAGQQQRLGAEFENVKASIGNLLLPAMTDLVSLARQKVIPELENFQGWLEDNQDEIKGTAKEIVGFGKGIADNVIPPLKEAGEVVVDLTKFFAGLPGPVKEVGIQAGIAALVFPRLAAGFATASTAIGFQIARLKQLQAEMTYTATRAQLLQGAMTRVGAAAKTAAGIGGMVALAQASQQTSTELRVLGATAGGALLGFSVGGPWGAAIGAGAGALYGLASGAKEAEEAARVSTTTWQTYASTLDDVTGATTRATKAMIIQELQEAGILSQAAELGIAKRDLVNGILGEEAALGRLNSALRQAEGEISDWALANRDASGKLTKDEQKHYDARLKSIGLIREEIGEVGKAKDEWIEKAAILRNIPENVVTAIQTPGLIQSRKDLANLAAQYNLTPRQIVTAIKMSGIKASKAEIAGLAKEIKESGNVKPSDAWSKALGKGVADARQNTKRGLGLLNGELEKAGDVKPNIAKGPFGRGVSGDLSALLGTARTGGTRIGDALGSGMYGGLGKWISPISSRASGMVAAAIKSAEIAGNIQSPSKKMRYVGDMLGAGLDAGLKRSRPKAKTAGQKLMQSVLAGVVQGGRGVESAIASVTKAVQKSITGKKQAAREKAYLKTLRDEFKALRANAKAQDALVSGDYTRRLSKTSKLYKAMTKAGVKNLQDARAHLRGLREELDAYRASIRDTVNATGDVTQLGRQDDGTVAISTLLRDLETKTLNAERFEVLLQQLANRGLSRASIQQMLDAGPEAALATAEAIAFGGAEAIAQMNALQERLAKSGDRLGANMADRYYGAGVNAAKGIVKGLEAEAKRLDKAAVRMANALVKAVKKALGIKSPSRVFRTIADQVTDGLTMQLDDNGTYVKRSGAGMAASLVDGFGDPRLSTYASTRGGGGGQTITLDLHLTADVISAAQQGKRITRQVRAGYGQGARTVAVTGL